MEEWLKNPAILEALLSIHSDKNFVDLDPLFNMNIDEDFDYRASGITRTSFCNIYHDWITYCAQRRENVPNSTLASGKVKKEYLSAEMILSDFFYLNKTNNFHLLKTDHNF